MAITGGDSSTLDRIRAAGVLRVGTTGDYTPFSLLQPDGSYRGADIDMAHDLAGLIGVDLRFVATVWVDLLDDFLADKFDIAMGGHGHKTITILKKINSDFLMNKKINSLKTFFSSDLFLMPSQSESFGLSALEAMSCEIPVISSSVGGLPELVLHGETGYIAEIGDIERMAKYAIELLTNPARYKLFAAASRKRAVDNFSSENVINQYEQYYEQVLSEKSISAK